jgi:hypothetical protein
MLRLVSLAPLAIALAACGTDNSGDASLDAGVLFSDAPCNATYRTEDQAAGIHVSEDAAVMYATNPPSSGPHYPDWATWGVHTDIVPREYYVHNEEHGGVIVLYRCDADCTAIRAQLTAFVMSLPPEPTCMGTGVTRRIVLTEDPLIDTPVAAAAWGWTYHAQCFDMGSLFAFVHARTGHAPEDFCSQGTYP